MTNNVFVIEIELYKVQDDRMKHLILFMYKYTIIEI